MKKITLWILSVCSSAASGGVSGGAGGVGIVKGTITIGGKPATDAVVSVEGLPEEHVKAQIVATKAAEKSHGSAEHEIYSHGVGDYGR